MAETAPQIETASPIAPKPVLGWRLYVQCERGAATEVRSRSALQILGRRWHRLTPAAKQPYLAGAVVPRRLDEDDDVGGGGSGEDTEEEEPAATQGNATRYALLLFYKQAPSLVLVSGVSRTTCSFKPHLVFMLPFRKRGWKRGVRLAPASDIQNMKLHRVATLFEGVVDRFLAADPNVQSGGSPEPVRFKPPGKAVTLAIVTETLPDDDDKGKRFVVQVKIPERPGFSLEYPRVSRRRIERVQPRLCYDPRWMRCIVESTGFKATEVCTLVEPLQFWGGRLPFIEPFCYSRVSC